MDEKDEDLVLRPATGGAQKFTTAENFCKNNEEAGDGFWMIKKFTEHFGETITKRQLREGIIEEVFKYYKENSGAKKLPQGSRDSITGHRYWSGKDWVVKCPDRLDKEHAWNEAWELILSMGGLGLDDVLDEEINQ